METINVQTLSENIEAGNAQVIDVRTPGEYESVHMGASVNVPLHEICAEDVERFRASPDAPVLVLCQSGTRAKTACNRLGEVPNLVIVEGGIQAWQAAGLPVVKGRETMSLERQVRIAAGSLVFVATLLGYFVLPVFLLVSGFVGAGLVFAGVMDTCGMAIVLSKCPWNKGGQSSCAVEVQS